MMPYQAQVKCIRAPLIWIPHCFRCVVTGYLCCCCAFPSLHISPPPHIPSHMPLATPHSPHSPHLTHPTQYDEQLVPPTYKSRRYSTRDVKFVSKKAPAQLKFKLNMASLSEGPSGGPQPPQSRGLRLVKHLFHPWLPMVLAVLHNVRSLPETVVLYM